MRPSKSAKRSDRSLPRAGGLVLGQTENGKVYINDADTHSLIIGATRCGKSRHLILPSIGVTALSGESMVITDPKAELFLYTKPFLERLGYEVIAIDFKDPEKSMGYNFLQPVLDAAYAGNLARAVHEARNIAQLLSPDKEGTGTDPLWGNGERAVITMAILAVCLDFENPEWQNLDNARKFIAEMCSPPEDKNAPLPLTKYLEAMPDDSPLRSAMAIARIAPEKMRGSFYTSALTTLDLFKDPGIHGMTAMTEYDHLMTGDRKRAIFLIFPDHESTYYPLISLFVFQQYQLLVKRADENGGRLPRRVEFFLDEFGNFVKIPDMDKAITVGGGRGIRFHLVVQDDSQIYQRYGKEIGKTMLSNCETWVYLQTKNDDTLEMLSKQLGKYTVKSPSLSASTGGNSSASYNLTGRELLTTEEIRRIRRPYQLVLGRNDPVMMVAPDISKTVFNDLYGLGDVNHNQRLRIFRDLQRPRRDASVSYWDGYRYFTAQRVE